MHADRWTRICQLYDQAAALSAADREAFLTRACGTDRSLREELESLLAEDEPGGAFLEVPAVTVAARLVADDLPVLTGRMFGLTALSIYWVREAWVTCTARTTRCSDATSRSDPAGSLRRRSGPAGSIYGRSAVPRAAEPSARRRDLRRARIGGCPRSRARARGRRDSSSTDSARADAALRDRADCTANR